MGLKIIPSLKNSYPIKGIYIESSSIIFWISQMQYMGIDPVATDIYPIPGNTPNSVDGCLLLLKTKVNIDDLACNTYCQLVHQHLFIPQYSDIKPKVTPAELEKLCLSKLHFLHPKIGLCELEQTINISDILSLPPLIDVCTITPIAVEPSPKDITSFRIESVPDKSLQKMLEEIDEQKTDLEDKKPLSIKEKLEYQVYKSIFGKSDNDEADDDAPKWLEAVGKLYGLMSKNENSLSDKIFNKYKSLEKRKQDEFERFMKMMEQDPEKALAYATPIDNDGTSRGGHLGDSDSYQMNMNKDNASFFSSLFNKSSGSGGGGYYTLEAEKMIKLRAQYRESAKKLEAEQKYIQASYIYVKLLQENHEAANLFENAKMYSEAAEVYDKLMQQPIKAAECYQLGRMYNEAIEIYKREERFEKAADIYSNLGKVKEANVYYKKEIDRLVDKKSYLAGASIYKEKMDQPTNAQQLLLEGWNTENTNSWYCLAKYFSNIESLKGRKEEIIQIYKKNTKKTNSTNFLSILKAEHQNEELAQTTKDLAYLVIADLAKTNKQIVDQLGAFNKEDILIAKDIARHKFIRKK